MSTNLPHFRYHPDPVASGSVHENAETCACCNRITGWIYTATFYTAQDVSGRFCPWRIANGSAAEPHPEALDQLRLDLRMGGWHDASQLEDFLTHLGQGASAMLFRCTVCGTHLFAELTREPSRLLLWRLENNRPPPEQQEPRP
ncbi:CbrC family protein [Streptomyces sp. NPDC060187]|uniref:CbrC family protein n=1 Tax=Streptomyces sp. NPDC060187 TaxID=3347067 RepID=UPI003669D598